MKKFQILFFVAALVFAACRKDKEIPGVDFVPTGGTEMIKSRLTGQVIDQAGLPIEGATVKFEQTETLTNEDGVFTFADMDLQTDGQVISVEKDGFFDNFKKIIPTENQTFQKIGLIAKSTPTGTFKATEGGTISKPNGEKIIFKPNSILSDGTDDYRGEVTVFTHHFNPENDYFGETMPGDLSGVQKNGEPVQLATYSMVLVELYGEVGQKLNLKPNTTATVEFPIKGSAAASAPETIPLWWLDENTGTWVEEFQATKQGDYYVGEVSHFSFWNCDDPYDIVNLRGTVIDTDGNPIPYITVSLEMVNGGAVRSCNANHEGEFGGAIPKNEELVLKIINYCAEVVHTENIGPFTDNQNITVTIDQSSNMLLLTGKIENCNGAVISDGYVVMNTTAGIRTILPIDADGNFSSTVFVCQSAQLTIYGVDETAGLKTIDRIINFTGQSSEDLGTMTACDNLDEFIEIEYGGESYHIENIFISLRPDSLRITSIHPSRFVTLSLQNPLLGINNTVSEISAGDDDVGFLSYCVDTVTNIPCTGNMTVELTRLDYFLGGYVEGVCTGNIWVSGIQLEPITIRFRGKHDILMIDAGGRVWDDQNQNGLQDSGEQGVAGIQVDYSGGIPGYSFNNSGVTDIDGNYSLYMAATHDGGLGIKNLPANYQVTLQDQGQDNSIDSDFEQNGNRIRQVTAISGTNNNFDCGIFEN